MKGKLTARPFELFKHSRYVLRREPTDSLSNQSDIPSLAKQLAFRWPQKFGQIEITLRLLRSGVKKR